MIVVDKISKYYERHAAVADVSFQIAQNEVVGLLGLNGAGKTTTLRILSGLLVPTAGRVVIGGADMAADPEAVRARIGFLPELPPLYPEMTVDAFLTFVARIQGVPGAGVASAVDAAIVATGLADKRRARIGTLSHGYQRRVGIAHAIVHNPALILLDEPTSGLDPVQIVHMRQLIRSLRERHTVVVSSHILSEIQQMCDRILVVHQGRIVAEGTEAELGHKVVGQTTVDLEVRGGKDTVTAALRSVSAVKSHTLEPAGDGLFTAVVELTSDAREELARALVQNGLGVRRLERRALGLESIFLQLTGDRPASGGQGDSAAPEQRRAASGA